MTRTTQETAQEIASPATNGERRLLTPREVCDYLQVKLPRLYELVRLRQLSAVRVGRQLRFTREGLERFVERNATGRW